MAHSTIVQAYSPGTVRGSSSLTPRKRVSCQWVELRASLRWCLICLMLESTRRTSSARITPWYSCSFLGLGKAQRMEATSGLRPERSLQHTETSAVGLVSECGGVTVCWRARACLCGLRS